MSKLLTPTAAQLLIGLLALQPLQGWAQLPVSELHSFSRQVVQIGQPFEISVHGNRLEELSSLLLTNFQGNPLPLEIRPQSTPQPPLRDWAETTGSFTISQGWETTPGLVEVRALGRLGASNSRTLLLVNRKVLIANGDHSSTLLALSPEWGQIVNSQTAAMQSKYYRYTLEANESLSCTAYCKQFDSLADIRLRLLDKDGRELASAQTLGWWPAELQWHHTGGHSTEFYVEVRDLLGRGGPQYAFALECVRSSRAGSGAVDTSTLNPAVGLEDGSHQTKGSHLVEGPGNAGERLHLDELLRPTLDAQQLDGRFLQPLARVGACSQRKPASLLSAAANELPVSDETSVLYRGNLNEATRLNFTAKQGQAIVFDVSSALLGQLTDPALVVYKRETAPDDLAESFRWIGDSDDVAYCGTPALRVRRTDPHWIWTAPEDGHYQLRMKDQQSGRRPPDSRNFLLAVRPPKPGFSMIAYRAYPTSDPAASKPWGFGIQRRGTDRLHVTVLRHDGFSGSIELSVNGLPEGCSCQPVIVQPGVTEATLAIQASDSIVDGTCLITVVGKAMIGESTIEVRATPAVITAGVSPMYNAILSRRSGSLEFTTVSTDMAPIQVHLGEGDCIEAKPDSKVAIKLSVHRSEGAAGECIFRPQDLPPKTSLGEVKIPADQNEVTMELAIAADAPSGEYTFGGLTESKVKWRVNPQALAREEEYLSKLQAALMNLESRLPPIVSESRTPEGQTPASDGPLEATLSKENLEAAISASTTRIEQLKAQTAEQEINVWYPSNPIRLRITP